VASEYYKETKVRLASIYTLLPDYVDAYLDNRDKTAGRKTVFQNESIDIQQNIFAISQGY